NQGLKAGPKFLNVLTFSPDEYPGFCGMNGYFHFSWETFDLDSRDAGPGGLSTDQIADFEILMQLVNVIRALGVPSPFPGFIYLQPKPDWMNLSTHDFSFIVETRS